jgi:hypothetical protein
MSVSIEHQRELMREFALIRLSDDDAKVDLPTRLLAVVERHRREYAALGLPQPAGIRGAITRGASTVDLEMQLPRGAAAAPPEVVAFRAWFLGEIVCQLADEPPMPWPDESGS